MNFLKTLLPETLKGQEIGALLMLLVAGAITYQAENPDLNVIISLFIIIILTTLFLINCVAMRFLDKIIDKIDEQ